MHRHYGSSHLVMYIHVHTLQQVTLLSGPAIWANTFFMKYTETQSGPGEEIVFNFLTTFTIQVMLHVNLFSSTSQAHSKSGRLLLFLTNTNEKYSHNSHAFS